MEVIPDTRLTRIQGASDAPTVRGRCNAGFHPHNPVHEETEFWYDTKENALLYEVSITTGRGDAEADHHRARESGRLM